MFFCEELLGLCPGLPLFDDMTNRKNTSKQNIMTLVELFNRFSNIAITRIDWQGLPESVNERFLNMTLYCFGYAAFFEDPNLGFLALPCNTDGSFNIYYEPTRVRAYSFNYQRYLQKEDFVFIRNNPTKTPTAWPVWEYTKRMSDILRTIDVLNKKLKQPHIFLCEEKKVETYKRLLNQVDNNEWAIIGSKDFGLDKSKFDLLDTRITPNFEDLWYSYKQMESILYTALGIESAGVEKKQRLIVDEVNANNMITEYSVYTTLKQLEEACKQINERWGLNVSVSMKAVSEYRKEDGRNVSVYDGAQTVS